MSEDNDDWGIVDPKAVKEQEDTIEIEIEGQEKEEAPKVEIEVEKVEEEEQDQESKETSKQEEPKELEGIETQGAQKRIRRLVAQRNQEREEKAELEKRIAEYERKLKEKEEESASVKLRNLEANETAIKNQLSLAEKAYRKALENGDADEIVETQKSLYSATLQMDRINTLKEQQSEVKPANTEVEDQVKTPQQDRPTPTDFDPRAVAWAQKHDKYFGPTGDMVFTRKAIEINNSLLNEGWSAEDEDFYDEIDRQLKPIFPKYYEQDKKEEAVVEQPEVKAEPKKPSQVVAGASRTVSNPATGRNRKVKLTEADIAMAEKWKIPLERYAEQKLAAEAAEEGEYTTINIKRGGQ